MVIVRQYLIVNTYFISSDPILCLPSTSKRIVRQWPVFLHFGSWWVSHPVEQGMDSRLPPTTGIDFKTNLLPARVPTNSPLHTSPLCAYICRRGPARPRVPPSRRNNVASCGSQTLRRPPRDHGDGRHHHFSVNAVPVARLGCVFLAFLSFPPPATREAAVPYSCEHACS